MQSQGDTYALDLGLGIPELPYFQNISVLPYSVPDLPLDPLDVSVLPDSDDDLLPCRQPLTPWPTKLPIELALGGEPLEETLCRFDVSIDDYAKWSYMPAFRKALSVAAKEIRENGVTFKRLCGIIAEDYLKDLDFALHDPKVPFVTKLSAFSTITKLAGLEPKDEKANPSNQNMVNIQINL
jgi:hypothetical protein